MGLCNDHDRIYFDNLVRTDKSEAVLSLIKATYFSPPKNKEEIAKKLQYAYELYKGTAGSYENIDSQFSKQYTIGLELGIWKNSNLELTDMAIAVAENKITIRDYFDIAFLNYFQPVNSKIVHILFHILQYMNENKKTEISKKEMADVYKNISGATEEGNINGAYNFLLGTNYFKKDITEKILIYKGKDSIKKLMSKCNTFYIDKGYDVAKTDLDTQEKYAEYLLNSKDTISSTTIKIFDTFISYSDYSPRFITSLLAKSFVILAGISGSGKTKIATDFAKWLKAPNTDNSLLVSVGADWTDNTKILGYYNSINKEYFKTEIIKLIERANANANIPFFLILDEMNLSRVERYFSDFLSKMEEDSDNTCFNLENYKNNQGKEEQLKFPINLFIIGTVNIDETTYMFSPKVLDRANVIEFSPNTDNVMENFKNDLSAEDVPTAPNGTAESFLELALAIRKTDNLDTSAQETAPQILKDIYDIFEENGKEFGFAYRTVKEIRHYINASIKLGFKDIKTAMDEQVLQKILPKIHGNRKQLETLLEKLKTTCDKNGLTNSSEKIANMQQKLKTNQFTSFI